MRQGAAGMGAGGRTAGRGRMALPALQLLHHSIVALTS